MSKPSAQRPEAQQHGVAFIHHSHQIIITDIFVNIIGKITVCQEILLAFIAEIRYKCWLHRVAANERSRRIRDGKGADR
jgi:hypothetical protein